MPPTEEIDMTLFERDPAVKGLLCAEAVYLKLDIGPRALAILIDRGILTPRPDKLFAREDVAKAKRFITKQSLGSSD
jgi:hypothetical protein